MKSKLAKQIQKREGKYIMSTPGAGMGYGGKSPRLKQYQGVRVGGRKITRFSQIKVKPAAKKTLGEKVSGGIKIAIL